MDIFHKILHKYWGYDTFRPLQEDIIHSVAEGKDTLGLMPTGGGKSLTFQVPTMAMDGLCLVITPLIALMKDQVDNLHRRGIKALAVYSGMTRQEIVTTLDNAILGDFKFLYISPERLETDLFKSKVREMNICMLVVDESHCISQWGYDFRPSYLMISKIREIVSDVPVLALTATATPEVIDDIQQQLRFKEKNVYKKSFDRKNLAYIVRNTENKPEELLNILKAIKGSAIVYVRSRKQTKEIADFLNLNGFTSEYYHAGLGHEEKTRKQTAWKNNESRIMVSTNAFGMGIDKSDVRLVIHTDLPNSIEEYFQEAGRAGRDELKAYATILYNKKDSTTLIKRISNEYPEREFIVRVYETLAFFFQIAEGYGGGMTYNFDIHQFCATYKLPLISTHHALRLLDMAGYIEYSEEINNGSRLMFTIYRDELYHYDLDDDAETVINTTLRLYTGLFANYANIDESAIATKTNFTRHRVYEILKVLSKRKIIDYIPHRKNPLITFVQPRINTKYVSIPYSIYENRRERFSNRITAMREYVEQNEICRNRILLSYFGEKNTKDCGRCDVCLSKNRIGITNKKFNDIVQEINKILIENNVQSINSIIKALPQYSTNEITDVIRFEADNGKLIICEDCIRLTQ